MITLQHTLQLAASLLLSCTLIACGGGGGGGGSNDTTSTTSPNSSQTSTPFPGSSSSTTETPASETAQPSPPPKTSVTLSWAAPTTRQNGDPLLPSELAGYEIYYFQEGTEIEDGQILAINDAQATAATITDLTPGTYIFAIASIDSDGLESDISDYVEAQIE